jgi:hypothetical protein
MAKTKVLLALGDHGKMDPSTGKLVGIRQRRNFFRKAAMPFIDARVKNRTDSLLVIYECAWPSSTYDQGQVNRHLLEVMDETLNRGIPNTDQRFSFGIEDRIVELNRKKRRVCCIIEMQTRKAMIKMAQYLSVSAKKAGSLPEEEMFRLEVESLRLLMASSLLRDTTVVEMLDHLRRTEKIKSAVVLRGLLHRPMRVLFDKSKYDLEIIEDGNYIPPFYMDAAESFYMGELDDSQLQKLASLTMAWNRLIEERSVDVLDAEGRRKAAEDAMKLDK